MATAPRSGEPGRTRFQEALDCARVLAQAMRSRRASATRSEQDCPGNQPCTLGGVPSGAPPA
eukprot:1003687-Pyramimonas_sp.AAC.1